jgi:simple sugar transport system permease protein
MVAGGFWAAIPGTLRAYRGVNEIISTVLLNFIAIQLVRYFLGGPFREPGATDPHSSPVPHQLPRILPDTSANLGFILGLVAALVVGYALVRTTAGLQLRALGGNPTAARYAGVRDRVAIIATMTISGSFAGLAGSVEVIGFQHRLYSGFSPGYGFEGLLAAIIARGSPLLTVVFAVLLGGLRSGGEEMQRATGVPVDFVFIIQAAVILILVGVRSRDKRTSTRRHVRTSGPPTAESVPIDV